MCGVQAIVRMPSATAIRAISSDVSRSGAPSSIPGRRWQCRSIKTIHALGLTEDTMWTSEGSVQSRSAAPAHLDGALSGIAQAGVKVEPRTRALYCLAGYITVTKMSLGYRPDTFRIRIPRERIRFWRPELYCDGTADTANCQSFDGELCRARNN